MLRRMWMVCLMVAVLATGAVSAAEIGLTSVLFPDGKKIEVPMAGTQRAPAAEIKATVRHKSGQSEIEMEYKKLPPAVLFGGDFVAYVVWAVSPDGTVENLGGIANETDKGTATFQTAKRDFALMVTAEPIVKVRTSGDMVVFFSGTPAVKNLKLTAFAFGGLSDREGLVAAKNDSIAGMTYKPDSKNPLTLIQAENAIKLLDRFEAKQYDRAGYDKAQAAIGEAREMKGQKRIDASERAIEAAAQALYKTQRMMEDEKKAAADAEAAAERQALAGESADLRTELMSTQDVLDSTKSALAATESKLEKTEADLAQTRAEVEKAEAGQASLIRQREALNQQLSGAIGQMATGTKTDRGYIVSVSGTAFPSGKSTLTTDAKYVLAKLSGMLLAMPDTKMVIEGHTDSTGSEELNRELSQARADAVQMFLREMGVPASRMSASGFGPDKPVAPNDNAEGRAKNRRVDIVLSEG